MTSNTESNDFYPELSAVIEEYSKGSFDQQVKALELLGTTQAPFFEKGTYGNMKPAVERILKRNEYLVWEGGRPSLYGIDAVVATAQWTFDEEWGHRMLGKILEALTRQIEREGYYTYALSEVSRGFEDLHEAFHSTFEGESSAA